MKKLSIKEKELLLKDLCARLPYRVMCHINDDDTNTPRKLSRIEVDELDGILLDFWTDREDYLSIQVYLSEVKPYLRPMSSMTEEEINELKKLCTFYIPSDSKTIRFEDYGILVVTHHITNNTYSFKLNIQVIDWLNKHQFDYHGLIKKGLALEAPEGMYK